MQLARAASNHEYLPSTPSELADAEVDELGGGTSSARTSSRKRGPSASSTAGSRGRRAKSSRPEHELEDQEHLDRPLESYTDKLQTSSPSRPHPQDVAPVVAAAGSELTAADEVTAAAAAAAAWAQNGGHLEASMGAFGHNQFSGSSSQQQGNQLPNAAYDAGSGSSRSPDDGTTTVQKGGNSRTLSNTKRAAQNRAAQRAFRERRDRKVKELETRAAQYDALEALYVNLQTRYSEAMGIIEALRRENEMLRAGEAVEGGEAAAIDPRLPSRITPTPAVGEAGLPKTTEDSNAASGMWPRGAEEEEDEDHPLNIVAEAAAEAARLGWQNQGDESGGIDGRNRETS